MTLDLSQIAAQIDQMTARLRQGEKDRKERLQRALDRLHTCSANLSSLKEKIEKSKYTWLVAGLTEGIDQRHEPPTCPEEFAVIATDGSHIDVDRHSPARCYLINIGAAFLHYGENPNAVLLSEPTLYSRDEELSLADPLGSGQEPVERALLGVKRTVVECEALARLIEGFSPAPPTLALLDGSLILWGLTGQADYVREELLNKGLLASLGKIKAMSEKSKLAVASYISFPRSTEVVNALRLAICPHEPANCDRYCPGIRPPNTRPCDAVSGIQDRDLFQALLRPGERSATFASLSSIVQKHYAEHEIRFFYVNVGEEVARVEIPRWIAEDGEPVGLVHSLVLDQCRRGHGYPVALTEAHEKAVVTATDREQFWNLVHLSLEESHLPATSSAKSRSKRQRWV